MSNKNSVRSRRTCGLPTAGSPGGWALLQGLLRRAGPGRRAYLLVLAVLAAALLRLVADTGRLLMTFAEGAVLMEPAALAALGDAGWPGWESEQASHHSASPVQDRPRPDETGPR